MNVQCIGSWSMCSRVLHPHQLNMMLSCLLMNTYHLGTALEVIKFTFTLIPLTRVTLWCQLEDTVLLIGTLLLYDPVLFPKYEA